LLRLGIELRREWNTGAGYQFDIAYPPQTTFNGVQGFDRPRRFDALPPLATSALYADLAWRISLGPVGVAVQPGLRLDMLHEGSTWLSGARASDLQPRLYGEIAPFPALRLRGGWGLTAKTPALGRLYPSPQYFDVVNVNWFTTDPAERLAVLTTSIRDPTTADLGLSTGDKREVGLDLATPRAGAALSVVLFRDRTLGGVGFSPVTGYLLPASEYTSSIGGKPVNAPAKGKS